jgi:hypothetical protein
VAYLRPVQDGALENERLLALLMLLLWVKIWGGRGTALRARVRATPVEVGREPSLLASTAAVCVGKGGVVCVRDGGKEALDFFHLLRKLRSAQVSKTS